MHQPDARRTPLSRRLALWVLPVAGIAFGAGCDAARTAGPRLPSYASRSPAIRTGYLFASGEGAALLTQLPCYCACAALGHKHLRDCFISDAGVFDSHAAGCQVCIDEALDARAMLARGTPARDIRAAIDRTYAGRGKPTDTPPVA